MKETLVAVLSTILVVVYLIGFGYIAIYLGMKLPYQLFQQGDWGFAIAQLVIVWTWILGGKGR